MNRTIALTVFIGALLVTANAQFVPDTPVTNFSLSTFDEATGWKAWVLRGGEGRYINADEIHVVDMSLEVLSGQEDMDVTMRIESPFAIMRLDENKAYGDSTIRLEGDRFSLEGADWQWEGESRDVTIRKDARVTFQQNLDYLIR